MDQHRSSLRRVARVGAAPAGALVLLVALTLLVWRQQVQHQRELVAGHAADIVYQASRRLQVFVESQLRTARFFDRGWEGEEAGDGSPARFAELSEALIKEVPGFTAVHLLAPDHRTISRVPTPAAGLPLTAYPGIERLLLDAHQGDRTVLSAPFGAPGSATLLAAVLPLRRGTEALGSLVVTISAAPLIDACFGGRIRSEFVFQVADTERIIYCSAPAACPLRRLREAPPSRLDLAVANRTWTLSVALRPDTALVQGWTTSLSVPAWGLLLSFAVAGLLLVAARRAEGRRRALGRQAFLAQQVLVAQEEERARLARELHDELGQLLTALRLDMGWIERQLGDAPADEREAFRGSVEMVERAAAELRRICRGLRPPLLDDLGIEAAIAFLVDESERRGGPTIVRSLALAEHEGSIPHAVALSAYRVLQESLTNVCRHARARRVEVHAFVAVGYLRVEVTDDGVGFDSRLAGSEAAGIGLEGMAERARLVRGRLDIRSAPGQGTRVLFSAPLDPGR